MKITAEIEVTVRRVDADTLEFSWPGMQPWRWTVPVNGSLNFKIAGETEIDVDELLQGRTPSTPPTTH